MEMPTTWVPLDPLNKFITVLVERGWVRNAPHHTSRPKNVPTLQPRLNVPRAWQLDLCPGPVAER